MVFTGDGKGKTTAAMGCALRMLGHGKRVGMVKFFKNFVAHAARATDHEKAAWTVRRGSWPGFRVWSYGQGFTWENSGAQNRKIAREAWKKCRELLRDPEYSMVIFDEINIALRMKFLKTAEVCKTLKGKPSLKHVILTGRGAPRELIRIADLVTEMKCVKHPFRYKVPAQAGIEF